MNFSLLYYPLRICSWCGTPRTLSEVLVNPLCLIAARSTRSYLKYQISWLLVYSCRSAPYGPSLASGGLDFSSFGCCSSAELNGEFLFSKSFDICLMLVNDDDDSICLRCASQNNTPVIKPHSQQQPAIAAAAAGAAERGAAPRTQRYIPAPVQTIARGIDTQ